MFPNFIYTFSSNPHNVFFNLYFESQKIDFLGLSTIKCIYCFWFAPADKNYLPFEKGFEGAPSLFLCFSISIYSILTSLNEIAQYSCH